MSASFFLCTVFIAVCLRSARYKIKSKVIFVHRCEKNGNFSENQSINAVQLRCDKNFGEFHWDFFEKCRWSEEDYTCRWFYVIAHWQLKYACVWCLIQHFNFLRENLNWRVILLCFHRDLWKFAYKSSKNEFNCCKHTWNLCNATGQMFTTKTLTATWHSILTRFSLKTLNYRAFIQ